MARARQDPSPRQVKITHASAAYRTRLKSFLEFISVYMERGTREVNCSRVCSSGSRGVFNLSLPVELRLAWRRYHWVERERKDRADKLALEQGAAAVHRMVPGHIGHAGGDGGGMAGGARAKDRRPATHEDGASVHLARRGLSPSSRGPSSRRSSSQAGSSKGGRRGGARAFPAGGRGTDGGNGGVGVIYEEDEEVEDYEEEEEEEVGSKELMGDCELRQVPWEKAAYVTCGTVYMS